MSALKSHVQKIEFRAGIAAKEDKGGSITGQFSEIGQNRGKLGKTERATFHFTSFVVVSQLQLITLNPKLSEFKLEVNQFPPFKDWSCGN